MKTASTIYADTSYRARGDGISYTAATAPVINTSNNTVATGDEIAIDIDGAGTGAKGLDVIITLQKAGA